MEPVSLDTPLALDPARAWRTYTGGSRIDALHGLPDAADEHFPEEWILSVVAARNAGREAFPSEGLSFLSGSKLSLAELISSDPARTLGDRHVRAFGATPGVLLKMIDAAERLTIQVHPDKATAKRLFHSDYGKTECWYILGGREIGGEKPCVYLGFREGVTRARWEQVFHEQNIPQMLGMLHRFAVKPGQTILIEGGVPHAIGAGCFLIEVQEPTDYSIRTERTTPKGLNVPDVLCHQGLGFETMFECFHYEPVSRQEAVFRWFLPQKSLESVQGAQSYRLVGYCNTPCFSLLRHEIARSAHFVPDGEFFGLYVLSGSGVLRCEETTLSFSAGGQFFVPAASKPFDIEAKEPVTLFECRGPNPERG